MFHGYKMLEGDWSYSIRFEGAISYVVSRTIVKTTGDFTMIIHYRHPYERSGAYLSANVGVNQIFAWSPLIFFFKDHLNYVI